MNLTINDSVLITLKIHTVENKGESKCSKRGK